jgi:TRAP-type mannitol/chloroaromatic compound transport system substrate-binding protein
VFRQITPPEASSWFRAEIRSIDDLKCLRMRIFRQAQVKAACAATMRDGIAEGETLQLKALQDLQAKGVHLHRWPP